MKVEFDPLPFPPSVNTYWRRSGNRFYKGKAAQKFLMGAVPILASAMNGQCIQGPVSVTIHLTPPDKRTRDIDNFTKGIFDAMTKAGVWVDDCQAKHLTIQMTEPSKPGQAVVSVCVL